MQRRSARRATPRKKYTVDAFEGIAELQESEPQDGLDISSPADDASSEEFRDEAEESAADNQTSEVADQSADEESAEDELPLDETPIRGRNKRTQTQHATRPPGRPPAPVIIDENESFSRGIPDVYSKLYSNAKDQRLLYYFGPSSNDQRPVFKAMSRWNSDACLPSRTSDDQGCGGLHASYYLDQPEISSLIEESSRWLVHEGGLQDFSERQVGYEINKLEAQCYLDSMNLAAQRAVVMGPFRDQKLVRLDFNKPYNLQHAWKMNDREGLPIDFKNGFIVNIGGQVDILEWAPNQAGRDQYLVVSAPSKKPRRHPQYRDPRPPTFFPQDPYPSVIQIWSIHSTVDGRIDNSQLPYVKLFLCTDWGDAKQLKWCPAPFEVPQPASGRFLGILAGIWADGAVRVLTIILPKLPDGDSTFLLVKESAFCTKPPNTICTCLAWIDGRHIAAGCANGCVAVWDVASSMKAATLNPYPIIYQPVTYSYILSIVSCAPSRPGIIVTTSMAGQMTMTDLTEAERSLCSDRSTIYTARARIVQNLVVWHEFSQIILHVDESYDLRGSPLRRFFKSVGLGKYKSNDTAIAASHVHPFVLVGTASGEVVSSNPSRRVINGKSTLWQQTWFEHEWRRARSDETAAEQRSNQDLEAQDQFWAKEDGLSRIVEGQKIVHVALAPDGQSDVIASTIYEEKSAITALAWNPNIHVGGWAAAGCGDGLLRIEDLAI